MFARPRNPALLSIRQPRRMAHAGFPMVASARFSTVLGVCSLSWSEAEVTGFSLPETSENAPMIAPPTDLPEDIAALIERVRQHLRGIAQDFSDVSFAWETVTPFQQAVLRAALAIGPGHTASYGEIATAIGEPLSSSRAVAAALGANPWPLLVPCHRIVGADGKMTGFSGPGGVRTKVRLLALEGAQLLAE